MNKMKIFGGEGISPARLNQNRFKLGTFYLHRGEGKIQTFGRKVIN